jgi:hypothetical protein
VVLVCVPGLVLASCVFSGVLASCAVFGGGGVPRGGCLSCLSGEGAFFWCVFWGLWCAVASCRPLPGGAGRRGRRAECGHADLGGGLPGGLGRGG